MSRVLSIVKKLERAGVAVSLLSAAVASAGGFARAAQGQEAADAAVAPQGGVEEIVVTARNRTERAQSVPVPISVIGGAQIDRERAFTIADLTQRAPALTATTPNARRTGVSIRGIGKTSGNDNMEAAVGVIVDDVFLGHVGMSYQDFTDLERVEILRGPQGTLLGKNTTLGVIKYTSRAPSFTPEGSFDVELGLDPEREQDARLVLERAGRRRARVPRLVLQSTSRTAISSTSTRRGGRWHERNRYGGRASSCSRRATPLGALQSGPRRDRREQQHQAVHGRSADARRRLGARHDLLDAARARLLRRLRADHRLVGRDRPRHGEAAEHHQRRLFHRRRLGCRAASLSRRSRAAREFHFDANNDQEQTRFAIRRTGTLVDTRQVSQEFRFTGNADREARLSGRLYLFNIKTDTTRATTTASTPARSSRPTRNTPRSTTPAACRCCSVAERRAADDLLEPRARQHRGLRPSRLASRRRTTLTLGLRRTVEDKTSDIDKRATFGDGSPLVSTGNATADAIRAAQLGNVYGFRPGEPLDEASYSWLVNPSYQLTDDVLLYASAAGGEKSGSVQFDAADGSPENVLPSSSRNFEVGVKSLLSTARCC